MNRSAHGTRVFSIVAFSVVALAVLVSASPPAAAQNAAGSSLSGPAPAPGAPGEGTLQQVQQALKARGAMRTPGSQVPPSAVSAPATPLSLSPADNNKPPADFMPASPAPSELSRMERLLSGEAPNDVPPRLFQFGYDVFRRPVSTFAPVADVPVGPDYVIGPGDGFLLTMWGLADAQYPLVVDRDGQIALPQVGVVKVWGMKYGDLESYLQRELARKFAGFKISITMNKLRTIQVYVVGEASVPGAYTVSSLSTVLNALIAAGGPTKNGTLRKIRLVRTGREPVEIDLYDFLLGGDKSKDVRLADGDTIFIPLLGPVVGVAGDVKRPAIYEMAKATTLKEVLDLAGGITFAGWLQHMQVERIENHQKRIVVDFDLADGADSQRSLEATVHDGDVVKVFPVTGVEQNAVYLEGHVLRPGKYEFRPGMKLSDLLNYDVFQPQVNLEYAEIVRLVPPDLHPVTISFNLGDVLKGDASANLPLQRFDRIHLFRWDEKGKRSVSIAGLVYDPNEFRLVEGMRVKDLIEAAGGLRKNAYVRTAEITRRHISQEGVATEKIEINLEKALAADPADNILLRDYDYLVIRPIPELALALTAEIQGEVRFPGVYPIQKHETLSSLIARAGGYTEQAYLRGTVFTRKSAMEVQRRRLDELISQVEESTLSTSQENISGALDAETAKTEQAALATKKELLVKLRAAQVTGRVVVHVTPLDQFKQSKYDLELEDGDKLLIPQAPGVVYVVGEVFNPTSLLYEQGQTVNYYLGRVGGMTKDADKKQVSVILADGSVISIAQGDAARRVYWDKEHNQWSWGGFMSSRLGPGDTIVVPRKIDKTQWIRNTKDVTQILFQIAVAAGVVLAI